MRRALLILAIGSPLVWLGLPLASILGALLVVAGTASLVLRRAPLGPRHARNVALAFPLVVADATAAAATVMSLRSALGTLPTASPQSFTAAVADIVLPGLTIGLALAAGQILITYALQGPPGRITLWVAYGARVILVGLVWWSFSQVLVDIHRDPGMALTFLRGFAAFAELLGALLVVPALLQSAALVLGSLRLARIAAPRAPATGSLDLLGLR